MKLTKYKTGILVYKNLVKYPLALVLVISLCGLGSYPVPTSTSLAILTTETTKAPEQPLEGPGRQTSEQPDRGNHSVNAPVISDITTNALDYPEGKIPRYAKFEITFQVETAAQNYQLPYDPNPPQGITPEIGVSVEALFTPDNWQTTYNQTAFYYQDFQSEVKNGREWFYPTEDYAWKVRFTPHQVGQWQYRLAVQDLGGTFQTEPISFSVVSSSNKGFMRVSQSDPRYFEFDQGGYFPALGYNMNFNHISWENPPWKTSPLPKHGENGIQPSESGYLSGQFMVPPESVNSPTPATWSIYALTFILRTSISRQRSLWVAAMAPCSPILKAPPSEKKHDNACAPLQD
jgi:hypothetical protein